MRRKNVFYHFLVIYLSSIVWLGCATTNITSFTDTAFQNKTFNRILIIANTSDLRWRQKLESRMVEAFKNIGHDAMKSVFLFPPTRNLSNDEKADLLVKNNIDAILTINVGERGAEDVYILPTATTTKTKGKASISGSTS